MKLGCEVLETNNVTVIRVRVRIMIRIRIRVWDWTGMLILY